MPPWLQVLLAVATPVLTLASVFGGMHVHSKWQRAEIERAHKRIDKNDGEIEELKLDMARLGR